jgi:hypothetical protein
VRFSWACAGASGNVTASASAAASIIEMPPWAD